MKFSLLCALLLMNVSWSDQNHSFIVLTPKDYSKSKIVLTSAIPRSSKTAERNNFNFNDIFLEIQELDSRHKPQVNLGSGTPNYMPAQAILDALVNVAKNQTNPESYLFHQYERAQGNLELVNAVAKFWSILLKHDINPLTEVHITVGSMMALDWVARSYLDPGDEAILFEPFYGYFRNCIQMSGGKMVTVPLIRKPGTKGDSSRDFTFDKKEFESKINKKTKLIWLNNPNNPFGKSFTLEELTFIGNIAKKYDLIILSDEAGQWYYYDQPEHIRIASLPGLFDRTITLNSGGKMFTNTGWRIAWIIGPEELLWPMVSLSMVNPSGVSTPLQVAYAQALQLEMDRYGKPNSYFRKLQTEGKSSRDKLVQILRSIDADIVVPTAGYSVWANFTKFANQVDLSYYKDNRPGMRFWKYMLIKGSISSYPLSMFYDEQNMWKNEYTLRFTNMKTNSVLDQFDKLITRIFKKVKRVNVKKPTTIKNIKMPPRTNVDARTLNSMKNLESIASLLN